MKKIYNKPTAQTFEVYSGRIMQNVMEASLQFPDLTEDIPDGTTDDSAEAPSYRITLWN